MRLSVRVSDALKARNITPGDALFFAYMIVVCGALGYLGAKCLFILFEVLEFALL